MNRFVELRFCPNAEININFRQEYPSLHLSNDCKNNKAGLNGTNN